MVVFHKLCRTAWSSRLHRTESVSVMGHPLLAAVCSIGSDQRRQSFFVHISSLYMPDPSELCFNNRCFNARYFTAAQNFHVRYFVVPLDPGYAVQATYMELVEAAYVTPIGGGGPQFAARHQGGDDYNLLDCNFSTQTYTAFLVPSRGATLTLHFRTVSNCR